MAVLFVLGTTLILYGLWMEWRQVRGIIARHRGRDYTFIPWLQAIFVVAIGVGMLYIIIGIKVLLILAVEIIVHNAIYFLGPLVCKPTVKEYKIQ